MKGAIGFSASKSWISKAIRWFRRSHVSHAFLIINKGPRYFVMEAGIRQVHITSYKKHYEKGYVELYSPDVDEKKIDEAIDKMIPYLEEGYGYLQLLGFAIVCLFDRVGIKIKNPIGRGIICSELVRDYLVALGFEEFQKLDKNTAAPDDLLDIIKKSSKFKEIERKYESNTD